MAKEANSNNDNTGKKNIQNQGNAQSDSLSPPNAQRSRVMINRSPGQLPHSGQSMTAQGIEYSVCLASLCQLALL